LLADPAPSNQAAIPFDLAALASQVPRLWPAGVAFVIAVGVWITIPATETQRVWIAFFVLGTVLPAIVAVTLAIDPLRPSPTVIRVARWLALLVSALTLEVGVAHGVASHVVAVAALIQALAAFSVMTARPGSVPQASVIIRVGAAVLWLAVSLAGWGVAGSLLWWIPPDAFLLNPWALGVLAVSSVLVFGALWLPDAVSGSVLRTAGLGLAVLILALASVRTNDLFDVITTWHWDFYIGPAELVRQGGWLLWDVPSQYGFLSELVIAWIPTPSPWEGLFLLNYAASFLLAMTVFTLLQSLGRGVVNLLMSVSVALVACLLRPGLFDHKLMGPDAYPSTGGFRFIWCVALLLVLLALLRVSSARARLAILAAGNLVWVFGVLWSAESAIYSSFVWLPGYFLMVMAERWRPTDRRRRLLSITGMLALPAIFLAAALAAVFLVYQVGLGHGPDLRAFYEYGLTYQAGFYSYGFDPGGPGWVLFTVYAATLVMLVWKVRRQSAMASVALVVTAAMIYATGSYFVGRTHPNNVWNLAPEICIAMAVTLALAGRDWRRDPVPILLRLAYAPIFIVLLTGTLGDRAAVEDYVSRPQLALNRIDAALSPTDPSLQTLLDANVHAGDRIVYVCDSSFIVDPVLSPHLNANTEQSNGAPHWLPLAPYNEAAILTPTRRAEYLERFIKRHPEGGWLIECIGAEPEWVTQEIQAHFTPGPTYANADYRLTLWRPLNGPA
jgi:hypothetical protein